MSQLAFEALEFAFTCHRGTYRKGTVTPYIVHPVSVVRILTRLGASEDLVAAGALHDVVEDSEATPDDLERRFGSRVASLVAGASEADKNLSWRARKEATLAKVKESNDEELLALICADKLDNICDISEDLKRHGDSLWKRFNAEQDELGWYYQSLTEVLAEKLSGSDFETLAEDLIQGCREVFGTS